MLYLKRMKGSYQIIRLANHVLCRTNITRQISSTSVLKMPVKVGDDIPDVDLYENNPGTKVSSKELFGKGKHVIFALPGAFTPTCHEQHAPTYVTQYDALKAKGVDKVACVSVNDPFVMAAWGKALNAEGKIRMLADTCGSFTKKVDMDIDLTELLGNVRSKRYAMVVNDGKVTAVVEEPDPGKATCSKADEIMQYL